MIEETPSELPTFPSSCSILCLVSRRGHVHADDEIVRPAAEDDSLQGAHVAEVAAPGDGDVLVAGDAAVGRIQIDVAEAGTVQG